MHTQSDAMDKAKKLLRLAQSDNPYEAALAASRAQDIMDRYRFTVADLQIAPTEFAEPITDNHAALDGIDKPLARWKTYLSVSIAKGNQCRVYLSGGCLMLVGRSRDVETVRYLYAYLVQEVDRLAHHHAKGKGKTYANNYRTGVVDTLARRLQEQRQATIASLRQESFSAHGEPGLVRTNHALMRIEAADQEVEGWMTLHLRLRAGSCSQSRDDRSARLAGREAGKGVRLGSGKALSQGQRRLPA